MMLLWSLGVLLFTSGADGRTTSGEPPLTLAQCVTLARTNAPQVMAQAARMLDARGQLEQAGTWPNPVFTATAQDLTLGSRPPGVRSPLLLQQTLSYPVFFGYLRMQEAAVARANVVHTAASLEEENRQLMLLTGRAYYDLLLAHELADIDGDAVTIAEEFVRLTERRVGSGDGSPLDIVRARAEETDVRRAAELTQRRRDLGGLDFSMMLGAEVPGDIRLARDWTGATAFIPAHVRALAASDPVTVQEELRMLAVASRPDIRQARASVVRAEEAQQLELRRTLPLSEVQLSVAARETDPGGPSPAPQVAALVAVSAPIPTFDQNAGNRMRARAQADAARAQLIRVERAAALEVGAAWLDWQRAREALEKFARPAVTAREQALDGTRRLLTAGLAGLLDVIAAQRDLLASRRALAQAERDAAVAAWRLGMAAGTSL